MFPLAISCLTTSNLSYELQFTWGFPGSSDGKMSACNAGDMGQSLGREDPLEKEMAIHSSILAGEFHGQRNLVGYSPWDHKESDTSEQFHFTSLHFMDLTFKVLKDDAVKVLHSTCQQVWKTQQWTRDWKRSVFIPIPKKGNAKECSNYRTITLISHASKVMLKIPQARLQQYVNREFPDVQADFRKGRGTRD